MQSSTINIPLNILIKWNCSSCFHLCRVQLTIRVYLCASIHFGTHYSWLWLKTERPSYIRSTRHTTYHDEVTFYGTYRGVLPAYLPFFTNVCHSRRNRLIQIYTLKVNAIFGKYRLERKLKARILRFPYC